MIKMFNSFVNNTEDNLVTESMAIAKKILKEYEVEETDTNYIEIRDILSPNFGYLPLFVKFKFRDRISIPRIQRIVALMRTYKNLLTSKKIDPNTYDNFEQLDDAISTAIIRNEDLKFAKSFISNKYAHLLDDNNINLFGQLRNFESSHRRIQMLLAKKLAAFKTVEELATALNQLISSFAGKFDADTKEVQVIENDGQVVYKSENELIARVPTFKSCKALGSSSWCISRDLYYFNNYASKYNRQFIYWDFRKDPSNRFSQIGITVNISNHVTACHDKYDSYYHGYNNIMSNIPHVNKNDILLMYSQGLRIAKDIQNSFSITNDEIKEQNPYYFAKLSDYKDFEDIKNFLKSSKTINRDDYLEILNKYVDNDEHTKALDLLSIKPIKNFELLEKLSEKSDNISAKLNVPEYIEYCFKVFNKTKLDKLEDLIKIFDDNKKLRGGVGGYANFRNIIFNIKRSKIINKDMLDSDIILLGVKLMKHLQTMNISVSNDNDSDINNITFKKSTILSSFTPIFSELFSDIPKNKHLISIIYIYINKVRGNAYSIFDNILSDDILDMLSKLNIYRFPDRELSSKYLRENTDIKCPKLIKRYITQSLIPINLLLKHVLLLNDDKITTTFVNMYYSNIFNGIKLIKANVTTIDYIKNNIKMSVGIISKLYNYNSTQYADIIASIIEKANLTEENFNKTTITKLKKSKFL